MLVPSHLDNMFALVCQFWKLTHTSKHFRNWQLLLATTKHLTLRITWTDLNRFSRFFNLFVDGRWSDINKVKKDGSFNTLGEDGRVERCQTGA